MLPRRLYVSMPRALLPRRLYVSMPRALLPRRLYVSMPRADAVTCDLCCVHYVRKETDEKQKFSLVFPDEFTLEHPWKEEKKNRSYAFDTVFGAARRDLTLNPLLVPRAPCPVSCAPCPVPRAPCPVPRDP